MWPKLRVNVGLSQRQTNAMSVLTAALAVSLCVGMFAFGIFISKSIEREIFDITSHVLARVQAKQNLTISVGSIETGLSSVTLNEVRVGREGWVVVDHIRIDISLIPWRDFLRVSTVNLGQMVVKAPWRKDRWPPELSALVEAITKRLSGNGDSHGEVVSAPNRYLPTRFKMMAARIEFADEGKTKILAEQVLMSGSVPERSLEFRARHIFALGRLDESFIEGDFKLEQDVASSFSVISRPNFEGSPSWTAHCSLDRPTKSAACAVDAKSLPPSLIVPLQRHLGSEFAPGFLGNIKISPVSIQSIKQGINLGMIGEFSNIKIEHPAMAVSKFGPMRVKVSTLARVNISNESLKLDKSRILVMPNVAKDREVDRGLPIEIEADARLDVKADGSKSPAGLLRIKIPDVSCRDAFEAVPPSFVPDLGEFELGGTASLQAQVRLVGGISTISIDNSRFDCLVLESPELYSAAYLDAPFIIERESKNGPIHIPVDPDRPFFASYAQIPEHTRAAFVSSEDSGFFQHNGVEMSSIVGAAQRNTEAGRAVVGGSTITMQTVKNLYLARDKTISRKAQEMFLAWHIERTISKERILEIYLNMVEFGPDLYGIGQASQRFFAKTPQQLTLKESVYLASLLPAPVARYRYFCEGRLTPNYEKIVRQLLDRMLALGRITSTRHAEAVKESLRFSTLEREQTCGLANLAHTPEEHGNSEVHDSAENLP
jgi:Transglycosylase